MKSSDLYKHIFGEDMLRKEPYKLVHHSFNRQVCGKQVCSNCGLMALNNDFTKWCIDKGCNADLHPQYKSVRLRLTRTF